MIVATYGPLDAAVARYDWCHLAHKGDGHYIMWRMPDGWIEIVKLAEQATVCVDWT